MLLRPPLNTSASTRYAARLQRHPHAIHIRLERLGAHLTYIHGIFAHAFDQHSPRWTLHTNMKPHASAHDDSMLQGACATFTGESEALPYALSPVKVVCAMGDLQDHHLSLHVRNGASRILTTPCVARLRWGGVRSRKYCTTQQE